MNTFTEFQTAILAAVAGLLVGGIVKLADKFFSRDKDELEMHVTLRKELREELDVVKEELNQLKQELDEWKEKYFHQVELTNALKVDILTLNEELNEYKRVSGIFSLSEINGNKSEQ